MIRRLAGGVGANLFDKGVITVTQLAMVPVMAAAWGLHRYGLWVLMFTAPSFLAISDFGFATAAGTKMTMAVARGERSEALRIFQSAWATILLSSAALVILAATVVIATPASWLESATHAGLAENRATLFLLILYGVVAVQGSIFFAGFRCAGLFAVGAFWNALIILVESSAVIVATLLGGSPLVAAATFLLGRLIGLAGQQVLLRRRVPWLEVSLKHASLEEAKQLLAPAGAVMLVPIAQACYLQGSAIALGLAAGQAAVPAFTAARTLSRVGLQMCWLVNTPLMPEFTAAAACGDRRGQVMMVLATLAVSAVLVVPYALLFAFFGHQVILIWTHGIIHSPPVLLWALAASILFGGFWFPISNLILALNRHAAYTSWFVGLAVLMLPVTWGLSRWFGAGGAGMAMAMLDLAMFAVIALLARRLLASGDEIRAAVPIALAWLRQVARIPSK